MFPSRPVAIGPYRVVRELGRGGMGVVYEVQDPQAPRTLALKLILPGEAGPDALARFTREAQLLARIRHTNVVVVHSTGEAAGAPYLVTDLVVGRDLKALARDGPLDPRRAAELVRALADAVAALHREGVLHRDLKPDNVLVREDGTPVLLDFGIAREVDGATLTRSGTLVGTPAYMAPEQADSPRGLDARADVYGLGGVLFFLLAGRPPFEGSTIEVLARLSKRDPVWPRATRPDVPADLEAIVRAAMAKERDVRPATADLLRDDLDRCLRGERPLAARASSARRLRRASLAALGALAALVVLAVAVGVATRGPAPAPAVASTPDPAPERAPVPLPARRRPTGSGGVKPAEARLLDEHRARWSSPSTRPSSRSLMTVVPPTPDRVANAYSRWLDDNTLVIVRDVFGAPEVRLVSLRSDGPSTATWSGLEHGPHAEPAPEDDHLRAAAVVRGARGPAVLITGDSQTIALVDASTPPDGRLAPAWTVPPESTGVAAAADSVTGGDERPLLDFYALAAAPDGRTIAVGGDWRRVWVIDLEQRRPDRHLLAARDEPAYIEDLAFSPDGQRLAVVRSHKSISRSDDPLLATYVPWRIEVWSVDGEQPELVAHKVESDSPRRPRAVAWAAGLLVVGHDTGLISSWRVEPGLELVAEAQLPGGSDGALSESDVHDLVTARDGRTVYAASRKWIAALVAGTETLSWTSALLDRPAMSIDVSPDGALLAVGDDGAGVTLWGAPPPPR